ncbi:MAG: cytochrome C oxidase subunit IV family protein [Putridiphycobacter sp.]|jgi:cytochrome c oxidase subunit 4|nr:cytochrome C oxidase subunit IV family protein [Putridiphycobacter sp.]
MVRDDIIEYSLDGHHSEEDGKKIRKKIWQVTAILSIITILEVGVGIAYPKQHAGETAWFFIKWGYIILTVIKAAYIVMVFMHLGDERKSFKMMILVPYLLFILYLIFHLSYEGIAVGEIWNTYRK